MEVGCDIETDAFNGPNRSVFTHTGHTLYCLRADICISNALSHLIPVRTLRENVIPTGTEKEVEAQRGSTFVQCHPACE